MSSTFLPNALRDALMVLTPDRPESIEGLRALYANDVVFRDPIQEVRGLKEFIDMNQRLMRRMKSLTWDITLATGDDSVALLEWKMRGVAMFGAKVHVDGMTRVRAVNGKIVDHRDYWDFGELLMSPIPWGQKVLSAFRSLFA